MMRFPANLSEAKILIVNDDSIHAEGIRVLDRIVSQITPHVWVVAPENQQTGTGHSLTIHQPLRLKKYDDRHFSVSGTPTDSTLMGVQTVMKDFKPDLILSGINHGQNTADDVTYSGTISAAMEGVLMEIPSIAFSQAVAREELYSQEIDWSIAEAFVPRILQGLAGLAVEEKVVLSVNFPVVKEGVTPEVRVVQQGHYTIKDQQMIHCMDPRGRPYFWIGSPPERDTQNTAMDVGALNAGHVTMTPLSLNFTHKPTIQTLGKIFS